MWVEPDDHDDIRELSVQTGKTMSSIVKDMKKLYKKEKKIDYIKKTRI